ncbi:MAG TPA: hypothetical protein PKG60_15705 [Spirochaetota bacterium]|nr:hypothetical protein [Spirochaetota bacterium]
MKKLVMLSMIALAAIGFIGCGSEDGTKADLRWINKQGNTVSEIQWMSSSREDQRWSGDYTTINPTTAYKGISELNGNGECLFADDGSGIPQPIVIDPLDPDQEGIAVPGADNVVVAENATATLVIQNYTKK